MRKVKLFVATALLTLSMGITAFAGTWQAQENGQWKYQNDDGSYATGWIEDSGKNYYLDTNGIMLANTTTPDGKRVGADGSLIPAPLFEFDAEKWHIKYTGYELSSDYEGKSCIIVYYDYTNKATEPMSAMSAWIGLNAYQNGVQMKGTVISSADENQSVENEYKKIMPGYTLNIGDAFLLSDTSPITFIVEDIFDWSDNAPSVTAILNIE